MLFSSSQDSNTSQHHFQHLSSVRRSIPCGEWMRKAYDCDKDARACAWQLHLFFESRIFLLFYSASAANYSSN